MPYRLYLDESGDHTSSHATDIGKRYLGLVGVSFVGDATYVDFCRALESFKERHLEYDPDQPPILHREDIRHRRGCYCVLRDDDKRVAFDTDLLKLVSDGKFRVVAVVIDKWQHAKARYRTLKHPYHYCLHAMLERYCGFLWLWKTKGDVMAESRGKVEDTALKEAYCEIWEKGTRFMKPEIFQNTLTSKQLKIKPKDANVAGLQLADILAHPLTRDVLVSFQQIPAVEDCYAASIMRAAYKKYNKQVFNGQVKGYGRIFLD